MLYVRSGENQTPLVRLYKIAGQRVNSLSKSHNEQNPRAVVDKVEEDRSS